MLWAVLPGHQRTAADGGELCTTGHPKFLICSQFHLNWLSYQLYRGDNGPSLHILRLLEADITVMTSRKCHWAAGRRELRVSTSQLRAQGPSGPVDAEKQKSASLPATFSFCIHKEMHSWKWEEQNKVVPNSAVALSRIVTKQV